jgi:hypothetical protein
VLAAVDELHDLDSPSPGHPGETPNNPEHRTNRTTEQPLSRRRRALWQHGRVPARPAGRPARPLPAGYSDTPLHRKLGIAAGQRVLVTQAPDGWDLAVLDPERTAQVTTRPGRAGSAPYDVVVAFCPDRSALESTLARRTERVSERGRLWVCWPKKSSGVATDLDENLVRELGLASGIVDVKVCAVDATWSGLCFMSRLRDRSP